MYTFAIFAAFLLFVGHFKDSEVFSLHDRHKFHGIESAIEVITVSNSMFQSEQNRMPFESTSN